MPKDVCFKCKESKDVKLCADDLLCHECDVENERLLAAIRGQQPTGHVSSNVAAAGSMSSSTTPRLSSSEAPRESHDNNNLIFSEMLAYVNYYRNRASTEKLRKTVVGFYSAAEITESKKKLVAAFDSRLPLDCPFRTERRKSTVRPAHDAETEDVIGIFDVLDRMKALKGATFAAVAIDRIPKYAPEETNIATMVDNQVRLESVVVDMANRLESLGTATVNGAQSVDIERIDSNLSRLSDQLRESFVDIHAQLTQLSTVCSKRAEDVRSSHVPSSGETSITDVDRTRNVVIAGVEENRDRNVWIMSVQRALRVAAGRDVQIVDAFRVGGRYSSERKRPILVKLQSVWDRRVVLGGARRLAGDTDFRGRVYINADEPVEVRRQSMIRRLKLKSEREGKTATITPEGQLIVDNVTIFCLRNGFIRAETTAGAADANNDGQ